jgi:hypothetical protein
MRAALSKSSGMRRSLEAFSESPDTHQSKPGNGVLNGSDVRNPQRLQISAKHKHKRMSKSQCAENDAIFLQVPAHPMSGRDRSADRGRMGAHRIARKPR